jgi:LL-diaminopimelate aminotransferase
MTKSSVFSVKLNENLEKILTQPYPFDVVDANKKKAIEKFGKDFIIDFGVGDPTDATPDAIRNACKKSVDDCKASGYPETAGKIAFRQAVCDWMKKRSNVSLQPTEVVASYGAKHACFQLPLFFLTPGKNETVLIPNPGYPPYTDGTLLAGGLPYYLNLRTENNFQPDLNAIDKKILKKARLMFLNSPHSPTGVVYGKQFLKEAVDFCNDNNIILVSDECYNELFFGERPASLLEIPGSENCGIVINSLSKRSMMTGYAVGFVASKNPELLKPIVSTFRKSIQGLANFIQDSAIVAWSDEAHTEQMRRVYEQRIDVLVPALQKIGCIIQKPRGTFYLWTKIPEGFTPLSFSEKLLLEFGINCVPGDLVSKNFNGENPGKEFVRIAMVAPLEKTRLAATRLEKWAKNA